MAAEIDNAVRALDGATDLSSIMGELKSYAKHPESCITETGTGFVLWCDENGAQHKLTRDTLRKRLERRARRDRE